MTFDVNGRTRQIWVQRRPVSISCATRVEKDWKMDPLPEPWQKLGWECEQFALAVAVLCMSCQPRISLGEAVSTSTNDVLWVGSICLGSQRIKIPAMSALGQVQPHGFELRFVIHFGYLHLRDKTWSSSWLQSTWVFAPRGSEDLAILPLNTYP